MILKCAMAPIGVEWKSRAIPLCMWGDHAAKHSVSDYVYVLCWSFKTGCGRNASDPPNSVHPLPQ
eukprot:97823-Pyramimonas_sp.AAC.1